MRITRGSQANCDFCFGHESFYRFGIGSCLATSHKQILKTPFNTTSSCILGFQATLPSTLYSSSVHCTLANRKVFLRQITAGCKHNTAQLDKWLHGIPCRGRFNIERTVIDLKFSVRFTLGTEYETMFCDTSNFF